MSDPSVPKPRAPRCVKVLSRGMRLDRSGPEARRTAACVLEVLAGVRTPEQAARVLSVSLPTYYNTETRALRGLIAACGPERPGRSMVLTNQLKGAQARTATLERELQRYQALLRATQRSVGLTAPAPPTPKPGGRRAKKPTVRALRAVRALREQESPHTPNVPTAPHGPDGPPVSDGPNSPKSGASAPAVEAAGV